MPTGHSYEIIDTSRSMKIEPLSTEIGQPRIFNSSSSHSDKSYLHYPNSSSNTRSRRFRDASLCHNGPINASSIVGYPFNRTPTQAVLLHSPLVQSQASRAENRQAHSDSALCSVSRNQCCHTPLPAGISPIRRIGFLDGPWSTLWEESTQWQSRSLLFIYFQRFVVMISTVDTVLSVSIDIRLVSSALSCSHPYLPANALALQTSRHIQSLDSKPLISCETPQVLAADPISPINVGNGEL